MIVFLCSEEENNYNHIIDDLKESIGHTCGINTIMLYNYINGEYEDNVHKALIKYYYIFIAFQDIYKKLITKKKEYEKQEDGDNRI